MNSIFEGIYAVTVTPFKEDGSFDICAAKKNLDYLIANGVHGVLILGATGEYMSVTDEEHQEYVRQIVPYVCNRVKVIVGATRERADDAIALILNAKKYGAHAAMVLSPPYCHPSQEEIVENYRYIMEKTSFPLVLYNNPSSCGISVERETFQQLFTFEDTAIVKESSGSIQKLTQVLVDAPKNISVFCGCDNLAFESFANGANGWISMLANVAPRDCVALFEAVYQRHDLDAGKKIYQRILPAVDVLESFPKPVQALKYLITRKNNTGGYCRRPRTELTEAEKVYILKAMHADELN